MLKLAKILAIATLSTIGISNASAAPIHWTDWQTAVSSSEVSGQISTGSATTSITQTNTATNNFVNTGNSGETNYWGPSNKGPVTAYTIGGINYAPTTSDMISLNAGGTVTINFGTQVTDAYIGLISWNGGASSAIFDKQIEIVSTGNGYWGNGTAAINNAGNGFTSSGELHGLVRILGTYSSFSFTSGQENWHGFSIGLDNQSNPVPVPPMIGLALLFVCGIFLRRK